MVSHTFFDFCLGKLDPICLAHISSNGLVKNPPSSFVGCPKILVVEGRSVW